MKKIIKLTVLTIITTLLGIFFGMLVFEHFLYSQIVFLTIHFSLVLLLILSFAKAMGVYEKGEGWFKAMSDFGLGMSSPFHSLVKELKLGSLLVAGMVLGFIGCLGYLESKDLGYFVLFALFPVSYIRAFITYQKFKEFR